MDWSIIINQNTPADRVIDQTRRAVGWLQGPRQSEFPRMIDVVVQDIAGINLNFPDARKQEFVELVSATLTREQFNEVIERIRARISPARPQFRTFHDMFVERRDREPKYMLKIGREKGLPPDTMLEYTQGYFMGPKKKKKKGGKTKRRTRKTRRRNDRR